MELFFKVTKNHKLVVSRDGREIYDERDEDQNYWTLVGWLIENECILFNHKLKVIKNDETDRWISFTIDVYEIHSITEEALHSHLHTDLHLRYVSCLVQVLS